MNPREPSRRQFLSATAGLPVAFAAHQAFAADAPPAEAPLRWGIIGTGTRGHFTHVPALKAAPQAELIALCDIADDRLQAAAAKVGKSVATYPDYQKLLANAEIDAVVIATPNLLHREMLLAALQAGKHVLCEKPAGVSPEDASIMKQAAGSARKVVMFGMQYRNQARNMKIRELLDSGRIGKPRYIVQNCSRGDWNLNPNVWQFADPKLGSKPMNWRFSHAATGGTLNEYDCHYFDLLHWIAGANPESVYGQGGIALYHDGRDTWDHATVTLKYPNDVTAVHTLSLFGPNRADVTIMGEEGFIESKYDTLQVSTTKRGGAKGGGAKSQEVKVDDVKRVNGADPAVLRLYEDFVACVRTGKKPDAGADRAVAASRTCWLAELSAQRKCEVRWNEMS